MGSRAQTHTPAGHFRLKNLHAAHGGEFDEDEDDVIAVDEDAIVLSLDLAWFELNGFKNPPHFFFLVGLWYPAAMSKMRAKW